MQAGGESGDKRESLADGTAKLHPCGLPRAPGSR
jgi:hypothetical protein